MINKTTPSYSRYNSADTLSDFLRYLAAQKPLETERLPTLTELSRELGISIASLREQLEVARALGLVDVKPKLGTKRVPYSFSPAVYKSVGYAIASDPAQFQLFADLRDQIEAAYWYHAVELLTPEDKQKLEVLIGRAMQKLSAQSGQIPHAEHRELHLTIYSRLGNPFVSGILEAYWELRENFGLGVYTDIVYLQKVWNYHQRIVDSILTGDFAAGYLALIEHKDLLLQRAKQPSSQKFE
ncbi:MAG: FadR family transcriptional regulator [Anaerolineaceae bacterium]|nr:FadR family transcriptional regulator [Anaerolineaceae bacterium]